jgi:uncharacterized protein YdcH (DUF465 family)
VGDEEGDAARARKGRANGRECRAAGTGRGAALRAKNEELEAKMVDIAKLEEDYKTQREKEHAEETARLKRQTLQLKTPLEQTLTAKPN